MCLSAGEPPNPFVDPMVPVREAVAKVIAPELAQPGDTLEQLGSVKRAQVTANPLAIDGIVILLTLSLHHYWCTY